MNDNDTTLIPDNDTPPLAHEWQRIADHERGRRTTAPRVIQSVGRTQAFTAGGERGKMRAADADRDVPRGVLEIQFPSLRVVHHRAYSAAEKAPAEVIPIDADVRAIRFQARTETAPQAIWFCTAHGVFRFREGTLERWGEDNGLASERCGDLIVEPDGSVWAATSAGPGRFDGKDWHGVERWPTDRDGEGRAARGLVAVGPQLWFGSPAGLWSMTTPARGGRVAGFRHDDRLLDDDVTGVVVDRFARLWVLGRSGVTRLEPEGLPSPRN